MAGRTHGWRAPRIRPAVRRSSTFYAAPGVLLFMVDLPGYGFAAAPKPSVEAWTRLVRDYLRGRARLARVFLLIDARHGLKPPDLEIMRLMDEAAVSYQGVLTKADKVKPTELARVLAASEHALGKHAAALDPCVCDLGADGRRVGRAQGRDCFAGRGLRRATRLTGLPPRFSRRLPA